MRLFPLRRLFPLQGQPALAVIVQFSPFYHGVRLMQCVVWGQFPVVEMLQHVVALIGFTLVLGFFALRRIDRKLTV